MIDFIAIGYHSIGRFIGVILSNSLVTLNWFGCFLGVAFSILLAALRFFDIFNNITILSGLNFLKTCFTDLFR